MRNMTIGKFMGQDVGPLFLFTSNRNICPCSMILRYSIDILNEYSIIALIKQVRQNPDYVIVDIEGNFKYSTKNP